MRTRRIPVVDFPSTQRPYSVIQVKRCMDARPAASHASLFHKRRHSDTPRRTATQASRLRNLVGAPFHAWPSSDSATPTPPHTPSAPRPE